MTAHYLYRCFDADHRLLYVGESKDAIARIQFHARNAFWADEFDHVSIKVMADRVIARLHEARAIRDEHPRYNNQGRWASRATWGAEQYIDYTRTLREGNYTSFNRVRLERLFREFERKFGRVHPMRDDIRAELKERDAAREAARIKSARESAERRASLDEADRIAMAKWEAVVGPFGVADCPHCNTKHSTWDCEGAYCNCCRALTVLADRVSV